MSSDDLAPPPAPRFVPTLTEVVVTPDMADRPAVAPGAQPAFPANPPTPAALPAETPSPTAGADLVEDLLLRLGPDLDRQIAEAVGRVLHEQMLGFNARVQKAVAEVVRDAIAKAPAQDMRAGGTGANT